MIIKCKINTKFFYIILLYIIIIHNFFNLCNNYLTNIFIHYYYEFEIFINIPKYFKFFD